MYLQLTAYSALLLASTAIRATGTEAALDSAMLITLSLANREMPLNGECYRFYVARLGLQSRRAAQGEDAAASKVGGHKLSFLFPLLKMIDPFLELMDSNCYWRC